MQWSFNQDKVEKIARKKQVDGDKHPAHMITFGRVISLYGND
jgi:hypothetical protein